MTIRDLAEAVGGNLCDLDAIKARVARGETIPGDIYVLVGEAQRFRNAAPSLLAVAEAARYVAHFGGHLPECDGGEEQIYRPCTCGIGALKRAVKAANQGETK